MFLLVLITSSPLLYARGQSLEYKVKAAYLYNFLKFTLWPEQDSPDEAPMLRVCILGDNPFGESLAPLENRILNGWRIKLLEMTDPDFVDDDCNLLFIAEANPDKNRALLQAVSRPGLLTVGESDHFTDNGGIIGFVIRDQTVKIQINETAAKTAGLEFDPRLLKLGRAVNHHKNQH